MKRFLTLLIITSVFATSIYHNNIVNASEKRITISEARKLAVENSSDLKSTQIELIKKDIELKQAKEGVKDIRWKESTVRFSLLFNIEWPETHGLPKEIDLVTKIPKIQTEIDKLTKKLEFNKLKAKTDAENAYYDVILSENVMNNLYKRLKEDESTLKKIETQYRIGKGSKEDLDYMKQNVENTKQAYQKSVMNYTNKKEKLGQVIGLDVSKGYTFIPHTSTLEISRSQLKGVIDYAVGNDFTLYSATMDRKMAETKIDETLDIYKTQFGSKVNIIEKEIKKEKIDYNSFIKSYNTMLENIDKPWQRYYVINMLFFKIKIPYRWFQGEYDALRYFEDEKYALFVSLVEKDEKVQQETQIKNELIQTVKDTYTTLKEMQIAYTSAQRNLEVIKKNYDKAILDNKRGLIAFKDLESMKKDYQSASDSTYELLINLNKTISTFNFNTSGYVDQYRESTEFNPDDLMSGDSFKKDEGADNKSKELEGAQWYIIKTLADFKVTFGVRISDELDISHYILYGPNKEKIGEKTEKGKTLSHLPLTFEDSSTLYIELYKDDVLKYTAELDGFEFGGKLNLLKVEYNPFKSGTNVGTYKMTKGAYKTELSINITAEELEFTDYEVYIDDVKIQTVKKDSNISHLSTIFSEVENILVKLLNKDKKVITIKLNPKNEAEGDLITN